MKRRFIKQASRSQFFKKSRYRIQISALVIIILNILLIFRQQTY